MSSGAMRAMAKVALRLGSSQHGKARRASDGSVRGQGEGRRRNETKTYRPAQIASRQPN
jgi:hypothetical protein